MTPGSGRVDRPTSRYAPEGPARRGNFPLLGWISAGVLVLCVAATTLWIIRTSGEFAYPLDDPYIHLRLAQNLATHFVLGINPGEFASAGSSTIWPLALAGVVKVTGVHVGIPLALDLLCAGATLVLLDRWARRLAMSVGLRIGLQAAMIFIAPLLLMTMTGMEHVLQVGLSILVVDLAVEYRIEPHPGNRSLAMLGISTLLLGLTRPEVLFVAAVAVAMLGLGRRFRAALVVGLGAVAPFIIVGVINLAQGWPALAASITAKNIATTHGIGRILPRPVYLAEAMLVRRLAALAMILLLILYVGRKLGGAFDRRSRLWIYCAGGITGLHALYSPTGWLYRYETYLVALCICASAVGISNLARERTMLRSALGTSARRWLGAAALFFVFLAVIDGVQMEIIGLEGSREVHEQQGSMAHLAAEACPGCRVVVNDIGMVSLYGNTLITDSFGLADLQVLEAKLAGEYTPERLDRIARSEGAQWAMVYDLPAWTPVPDSWIPVGTWEWDETRVVASSKISVFVIDPAVEDRVVDAFHHFRPPGAHVSAVPGQ